MTINTENLIDSIMESLERINYIDPDDIPNIDLYMDQVTTFMEDRLKKTTRNPAEDKVLTKTMINNYAKNDLLPPPIKKKYSKDHIMMLIFIYYYKGVLSISDIQTLFKPITNEFFRTEKEFSLEDIYSQIVHMEIDQIEGLKKDIEAKFKVSESTFDNAPEDSQKFLKLFSFVSLLSFDVYIKQLLIEKIIDGYRKEEEIAKPTAE